jgi:hypothetical protein
MKLTHLMIAAAGAALFAGSAMAQDQAQPAPDQSAMPPAADQSAPPPAADQGAMPPAADQSGAMPPAADQSGAAPTNPAPAAQYNYNANPGAATQPASSSTLGDAATMKAGDPSVVSNGPVPDTKENRAKYGKPMSNAGKKSAASGN